MGSDGPSVEVTIGIDYGTRFTKIAFSDGVSREVLRKDNQEPVLIRSIVYATPDGAIDIRRPEEYRESLEYLKILLAAPDDNVFWSIKRTFCNYPITDLLEPLAAAYLSRVIEFARNYVLRRRPHLKQRSVYWLVNVGVPVQHCDSETLNTFRKVAAVAYDWAERKHFPNLGQLQDAYARTLNRLDLNRSPTEVVPELAGALSEFRRDRNRQEALYGFFDVGGGTLDGAVFHLNRSNNGPPLRIHAARVERIGTMAVSRRMVAEVYRSISEHVEQQLVGKNERPTIDLPLDTPLAFDENRSVRQRIETLVATLIIDTWKHYRSEVFSPDRDAEIKHLPPLKIFVAGGGAQSAWYHSAIEQTYTSRKLRQYGLTGIRAELLNKPTDYTGNDYTRFVIALGLADPIIALQEIKLPSQFAPPPIPPERPARAYIGKEWV